VLLTPEQREELEAVVRRTAAEHREVLRARMILMRADGVPVITIARQLFVDRNNVRRWCDRFNSEGMEGLRDLPKPGRPPSLSLRSSASH
jgi:transposase